MALTATQNLESCLAGRLEDWPLPDLLHWLHQSGRTAMLRIGDGLDSGVIFFRDGDLYRCELARFGGESALVELLARKAGRFCLIQRQVPEPRRNIQLPTRQLLLQCTVALDERVRQESGSAGGASTMSPHAEAMLALAQPEMA